MRFAWCLLLVFIVFSCRSKQVVEKKELVLQSDFWVSVNKVQFIAEARAKAELMPLVYLREKSCKEAIESAQALAVTTYPGLPQVEEIKQEINYRMYTGEGRCLVIIHFSAPGLQEKLLKKGV